MARYRATLTTPWTIEDAFAYLSDFSNAQEWDPGVVAAGRVEEGAIRQGSQFRLTASFLGRSVPLTYRIDEYDPPNAVTFLAGNATVISRDRITFERIATGTSLTYDADLRLKGPLRLADPLLAIAFGRVGNRALDGLRHRFSERSLGGARR